MRVIGPFMFAFPRNNTDPPHKDFAPVRVVFVMLGRLGVRQCRRSMFGGPE
jgi:hypothetical protein